MTQREIQHLYWRAGFGIRWDELQHLQGKSRKEITSGLFNDSANYTPFSEQEHSVDIGEGMGFQPDKMNKSLSEEEKKERQKMNRKSVSLMGLEWLEKMGSGREVLLERMTFFWHDHFATQGKLALLNVRHNNTLRQYALGSFRDLLHAMVKDPQLLQYLNNNQNKKEQPNENLARELMELFTLGEGHYTEQDIKEAARALTGYGFGLDGMYRFFPNRHDEGVKTVFGRSGNFNGDDIIELILEQKQTALFITGKIYRYFVSEQVDQTRVTALANDFRLNNYDISRLLEQIFLSDWFYDEKIIGTRIKSPVDLVAGMMVQGNMELKHPKVLQLGFRVLGQVLTQPPNVAGWPNGRQWIDSSSLLFRTQLPEVMLRQLPVSFKEKEAISVETEALDDTYYNPQGMSVAIADWSAVDKGLASYNASESVKKLAAYLLQADVSKIDLRVLDQLTRKAETSDLESVAIYIMRMPEYQLC